MAVHTIITGLAPNDKPFSERVWAASGSSLQSLRLDEEAVTRLYGVAISPAFLSAENAETLLRDVFAARGVGESMRVIHKAMSPVDFQVQKGNWMIAMKKALYAAADQGAWVVFLDHFEYAIAREAKRLDELWVNAFDPGEETAWESDRIEAEVREMIANVNRVMSRMPETGYRMDENGVFNAFLAPDEVEAIERARKTPVPGAGECIDNAREFLGLGKHGPAIAQAIKALEHFTSEWAKTGDFKSGVDKLKKMGVLPHEALAKALVDFWGYANKNNVRHGNTNPSPDYETARFFVATCAAFVNYMTAREPKQDGGFGDIQEDIPF